MLSGTRVVVVGAGLAGLTAAVELVRQRASVRVVEARPRVGGRVWTRATPDGAAYVEAGGEFVDGDHAEMRHLVSQNGLRLARVLRQGFGLALRFDGRVEVSRSQTRGWRALARTLAPVMRAYTSAGSTWDSAVAAAIASHSVRGLLSARAASPGTHALADAMRGFYLAEPDDLSALVVVSQAEQDGNPGSGPIYRIAGGAGQLAERMAARLRDPILLGHVLRRVVARAGGVLRCGVETPAGRLASIDADIVIVAVPAPLVRTIEFQPGLPVPQAAAYDQLRAGAATKVSLRFERAWWRRRLRPRAFGTNLPVGAVWDGAEEQPGVALLTLLAGAAASAQLRARLASGGVAGLTRQLSWMGTATPARLAAPPVSWEHQPWSRGGYAVFGPDFDPRLRPLLGASHGRVLFAGEHTSQRWQGFMNGAVESGLRAAKEAERLADLTRAGLGRV